MAGIDRVAKIMFTLYQMDIEHYIIQLSVRHFQWLITQLSFNLCMQLKGLLLFLWMLSILNFQKGRRKYQMNSVTRKSWVMPSWLLESLTKSSEISVSPWSGSIEVIRDTKQSVIWRWDLFACTLKYHNLYFTVFIRIWFTTHK